ncbi:hypothetical protein [Pseudomonas sp. Irchel 3E19]|uniref:hypothetical protein n=1 Tax=Pseudomonas sp. Irchel 3E19 TaxID=2008981 RepID=UPI000BA45800|nr:hypothetical protein [Pseudomonas sp. Irchel 3E19]
MISFRAFARTFPWLAIVLMQASCSTDQQIHQLKAVPAKPASTASTSAQGATVDDPSVFFAKDGHFYTAGYVAYLAGYHDLDKIQRISCFTQTPDEEFWKLNAVPVSIYGITPGLWTYRRQVVNGLHSLHGGDTNAVYERRARLKKMIEDAVKPDSGVPDWQLGFLIHAFGDSYAHVKGKPPQAYGPGVGHMFDSLFGDDPDAIFINHHYEKYNAYVNSLFAALASGQPDSAPDEAALQTFTGEIARQASEGDDPDKAVTITIKNGSPTFDWDKNDKLCESLNTRIAHKDINDFLEKLSNAL